MCTVVTVHRLVEIIEAVDKVVALLLGGLHLVGELVALLIFDLALVVFQVVDHFTKCFVARTDVHYAQLVIEEDPVVVVKMDVDAQNVGASATGELNLAFDVAEDLLLTHRSNADGAG